MELVSSCLALSLQSVSYRGVRDIRCEHCVSEAPTTFGMDYNKARDAPLGRHD